MLLRLTRRAGFDGRDADICSLRLTQPPFRSRAVWWQPAMVLTSNDRVSSGRLASAEHHSHSQRSLFVTAAAAAILNEASGAAAICVAVGSTFGCAALKPNGMYALQVRERCCDATVCLVGLGSHTDDIDAACRQ